MISCRIAVCSIVSLFFVQPSLLAITVKGVVRDVQGNGLPNATLRVYYTDSSGALQRKRINAKSADPAKGTPDGYYELDIPSDSRDTIKFIEYDDPNWHSGVVSNLSRQNTHNGEINVVLLLEDGPKSFPLILRQIRDYESLFYIEQQYLNSLDAAARSTALAEVPAERYFERIERLPNPRHRYENDELQGEVVQELRRNPRQENIIRRELDELYDLYGLRKPLPTTRLVCKVVCCPVNGAFGHVRYVNRHVWVRETIAPEPFSVWMKKYQTRTPKSEQNHGASYRTWRSNSGKNAFAQLERFDGSVVYFRRPNGTLGSAPMKNLVKSDQDLVEAWILDRRVRAAQGSGHSNIRFARR